MTEEVKDPNSIEAINIDGTPHSLDSLSEKAKYFVNQLQDVGMKMAKLRFELAQAEVANNGFMQLLRDEIANPEEVPDNPEQVPVEVVKQ